MENKICTAEGHLTTFYLCPECGAPNTLRMNKEHFHMIPTAQCWQCRRHADFGELLSYYGPRNPTSLYFHCVEYICDECGRTNFIRNDIQREAMFERVDDDPSELWKPPEERSRQRLYISGSQLPARAVCDHCGQRHYVSYED